MADDGVLVPLADDSDALLLGPLGFAEDLGDWVEHLPSEGAVSGWWILRFPRPKEFDDAWNNGDEPDESLTNIEVTVDLLDAAPTGEPERRFSRAVELSCPEPAELEGSGSGPAPTAETSGPYRLRLMVDDSRFPTCLSIQSWPAPVEAGRVLRGPRVAEEEPRPDMFLPEVPAGVAAATRIGLDIDGGAGARKLSGELGVAHASLVLPRSPAWHADHFDRAYVLTANPDYTMPNYTETRPDPGTPDDWWSICVMEHEAQVDHITGWYGAIWTQPHPDDDPRRRRVHRWRWVRRIPPASMARPTAGEMLEPVLASDTFRIMDFNRVPGTPVHTEIVIEHRDVPVEWADDLSVWWTLQLALHARRV